MLRLWPPVLFNETFAVEDPSVIRPVMIPAAPEVRNSAVVPGAVLVIVPATVTPAAALAPPFKLTPLRSRVAPCRMTRLTLVVPDPRVVVLPNNCIFPSLMVSAPVWALTALRMSNPGPFLVRPPVVVAVTGAESVRMSEAPLTRMTKSPADAVVIPVPVIEAPVVAPSTKIPPPAAPPMVSNPVSVRGELPEILREVTDKMPVEAVVSIATFVAAVRVLTVVKPIVVP